MLLARVLLAPYFNPHTHTDIHGKLFGVVNGVGRPRCFAIESKRKRREREPSELRAYFKFSPPQTESNDNDVQVFSAACV